ncbi:MAG: hypothetical protein A2V67_09860 [Deltaproteobacteria bacterium RBG_13_61_14]|nr:MAG: hypothetical protein A2V67_09860 [Deltaproteobacteria bacterium RBG_13_61_14]
MPRIRFCSFWIWLGFAALLALHLLHLRYYFFLTDDAFISFRYLHNWIEGRGLVFNPGERVEGYTNFLWIVLLAPLARLNWAPEKAAPVLSILSSLITLILVFFFPRLARQEKEMQPGWLLAPMFLALHRSFAVWATSGLETRLFTLLLFLGALFAFRTSQNVDRRDPLWAGLFFALAELCRPEAVLFFATASSLVVGRRLWQRSQPVKRSDLAGVVVFLAITAAHYLGRHWYYSQWLPNTFYAKVDQPWWSMGLYYLGMFVLEYSYWLMLPLLVVFLSRALKQRNPVVGFLVGFPLPYLAYIAYLGGDHFEYRFLDPVLPFLALLLQECLRFLARAGRSLIRKVLLAGFLALFMVYSTTLPFSSGLGFGGNWIFSQNPPLDLNQAPWLKMLPGFISLAGIYKTSYKTMTLSLVGLRAEEHRLFGQGQTRLGHLFQDFIQRGYLSPNEIISTGAVGALPYYSGLATVDFFGLTDRVIARMKPLRMTRAMFHDKIPFSFYLKDCNVDYVLLGSFLVPARPEQGLPTFNPKHRLNLRNWPDRVYLLDLGPWLLMFQSPQNPMVLQHRFQRRGVPIYLYLPAGGRARPVPLAQALERFPELIGTP